MAKPVVSWIIHLINQYMLTGFCTPIFLYLLNVELSHQFISLCQCPSLM